MTDDQIPLEDRVLFDAIARLPRPQAPGSMPREFRARARAEPRAGRSWRPPLFVPIAALALLAVGGGWWLSQTHQRPEIDTLPAPARLQAVNVLGDSPVANGRIISALTTALLTDSSTNVRVAAAQALGRIAAPSALRDAAARSIRSDPSPFVQATLLDAITRLSRSDRAALLRALLARPDLDPVIRAEAEMRKRT